MERSVPGPEGRAAGRPAAARARCSSPSASCSRSASSWSAAALFGAFLWWRGTLFETRWYLRTMAQTWWMGFVAVIAGWVVTESGRQPWIVQGILRTADATSPVIGPAIAVTLRAVRPGLRHRVFGRHLFHQPPDRQGPRRRRDRASPRSRSAARSAAAGARARAAAGGMTIEWLSAADLGRHHRHRGRDLRHPRRLRSRHRHPVSVRQGRRRARPDDGVDRAVLGRQRDLAGARRRRPAGGVPAGLCDRHAGALSAGDRHAAGAGVSRRGVRVPRDRRQQGAVEHGLRRRLDARRLCPGRDPRRHRSRASRSKDGAYAGGTFDWATPFALLCGLGVSPAMRCSARPG